jgi:hypothetical protein
VVDKVVSEGKKIAAHLLEASEADLEFKNGQFTIVGTDKTVWLRQDTLRRRIYSGRHQIGLSPMRRRDDGACRTSAGAKTGASCKALATPTWRSPPYRSACHLRR